MAIFCASLVTVVWMSFVVDFQGPDSLDISWCMQRYGEPAVLSEPRNSDFVANATATWNWWPPGKTCVFSLPGGSQSDPYTPPEWRSWVLVLGLSGIVLSLTALALCFRLPGRARHR